MGEDGWVGIVKEVEIDTFEHCLSCRGFPLGFVDIAIRCLVGLAG